MDKIGAPVVVETTEKDIASLLKIRKAIVNLAEGNQVGNLLPGFEWDKEGDPLAFIVDKAMENEGSIRNLLAFLFMDATAFLKRQQELQERIQHQKKDVNPASPTQ